MYTHCLRDSTVERRSDNTTTVSNKKSKKTVITKSASAHALDPSDQAALNRRAARFHREHELERQKGSHNGSYSSSLPAHRQVTQFNNSRSNTPSYSGDEPEANPVRQRSHLTVIACRSIIF